MGIPACAAESTLTGGGYYMRFLHLADLHLGKVLHKQNLLSDQRYILDQILQIADEQQVDAVLIAGDVYQRNTPSAEAMSLFSSFVTALAERKLPCMIISGNHDSAERVAYLAPLAALSGVHISGADTAKIYKQTLHDEYGEIVIHMMPFTTPLQVRAAYPEQADEIQNYNDAIRILMQHLAVDPDKRNIMIAHQFLTGAQVCDSEELAIGGLDNISASLFDAYDYTALGHLHGPQQVTRPEIRYAGSPLKYSFSEVHQHKSVTIVHIKEKGCVSIETVQLKPLREMQVISGSFAELMEMPRCEDYVQLNVTDADPPANAARSLHTVFPNCLQTLFGNADGNSEMFTGTVHAPEKSDFLTLLKEFYAAQHEGAALSEAQTLIVQKVLETLDQKAGAQ